MLLSTSTRRCRRLSLNSLALYRDPEFWKTNQFFIVFQRREGIKISSAISKVKIDLCSEQTAINERHIETDSFTKIIGGDQTCHWYGSYFRYLGVFMSSSTRN